jgi:hypothetical protein
MKYLIIAICCFGTTYGFAQELTAIFKAKSEVFKTERGMPATQFEIVANDEQIQHMVEYTNPLFDHLKFVHTKQVDNNYDVIIYFKASKDFNYVKSTLINLGIEQVIIGEETIQVEELVE